MFATELTETEWLILTCIVSDGKIRGFENDLRPDMFAAEPQAVKDAFLDSGSRAGWLLLDPETKESFLHEDMEFMLHVVSNPMSSFTCRTKSGSGFLWGCYFKNDTIILINHVEDEEKYIIAWVPTIPYLLGATYKKIKEWFAAPDTQTGQDIETSEVRTLRCSFQTDDNSTVLDWIAQENDSFLLKQEGGEVFHGIQSGIWEGTISRSFKEVFDSVALWIVKAHGNSMRGMIENG